MDVIQTTIPGVLEIKPDVFGDDRGFFFELWQQTRYANQSIPYPFVQDNVSKSKKGVLRGLHFQTPKPQGKLVTALTGVVFDVAIDIRLGSPTFRQWVSVELDADKKNQLYIPPGFAHGFEVLSQEALFCYKCTEIYIPQNDKCIRFDDPEIGVRWHSSKPSLSAKDENAPFLKDLPESHLPDFIS